MRSFAGLHQPIEFKRTWLLIAAGLASLLLVGAFRVPDAYALFQQQANVDATQRHPFEDKLLKKINQYAPQTDWMLTDMPMFAFRAGVKVPPNLVVISWKRLAAGDLTKQEILNALQTLRPEQVLFGRFQFTTLNKYIAENYDLVLERSDEKTRLYIRKDLRNSIPVEWFVRVDYNTELCQKKPLPYSTSAYAHWRGYGPCFYGDPINQGYGSIGANKWMSPQLASLCSIKPG